MRVKNIYQDDEGKWHIDYGFTHLMGLAIRVYFGELVLILTTIASIIIVSTLAVALVRLSGLVIDNSLPEKENNSSSHDVRQKPIEGWLTK